MVEIDSLVEETKKGIQELNTELATETDTEKSSEIRAKIVEEEKSINALLAERQKAFINLTAEEQAALQQKIDDQKAFNALTQIEQIQVTADAEKARLEETRALKEAALLAEQEQLLKFEEFKAKLLEE